MQVILGALIGVILGMLLVGIMANAEINRLISSNKYYKRKVYQKNRIINAYQEEHEILIAENKKLKLVDDDQSQN